METVWEEDQEVEKRFSDGDCFDEQRKSIGCSLEAIKAYDEDAVEEAYGREIVQAHDAAYDEVVLELRSSDHGRCLGKVLWPPKRPANPDALVFKVCDKGDEDIEGLNSFVAA